MGPFASVLLLRVMYELIGSMRRMILGCMQLVLSPPPMTTQSENAY